MTLIKLTTYINSNIERCFDLSRDVDFHKLSVKETKEEAIDGRKTGLCELGDKITWEAIHFGIKQKLSVEISKFDKPNFFEDRMTKGIFKSMRHEHHFEESKNGILMTDLFFYEVPFGIIGQLVDKLILKKYMTRFLLQRNKILKEIAEKKIVFS